MKNLLIRIVTGLVFGCITIGSLLLGKLAVGIYFLLAMSVNLFEFYRLYKGKGINALFFSGLAISICLFASVFFISFYQINSSIFFALVPLLLLLPIIELLGKSSNPMGNIATTILGVVYIAVPFTSLILLSSYTGQYESKMLLALFCILWANDSGAYLVGSSLGKHKLLERISPKKTWEGAIGGAIFAVIASLIVFRIFGEFNVLHAIAIGLVTVVSGTLGDLTESMIKRQFNVKDSGNILPGHGGLLDRFDSLLFSAPVFYMYISIFLK